MEYGVRIWWSRKVLEVPEETFVEEVDQLFEETSPLDDTAVTAGGL